MQYTDYDIKNLDYSEVLPIQDIIERDICLLKTGDLAVIMELDLPEIYTLSKEDYRIMHTNWNNAIKLLDPYTTIHKQDIYTKTSVIDTKEYKDSSKKTFLAKANSCNFSQREYLQHKSYLYITRGANKTVGKYNFGYTKRDFSTDALIKRVASYKQNIQTFISTLENGNYIKTKILKEEEIISYKGGGLYKNWLSLNYNQNPIYEKLVSHGSKLWVGDKQCNVIAINTLSNLPESLSSASKDNNYNLYVSFLSKLGSLLNCNHITNQYISIQDKAYTEKVLKTRIKRYNNFLPFSIYNQLGKQDTEYYLEEVQEGRIPVKAHLNIMLFTKSEEHYNYNLTQIQKALTEIGFEGVKQSPYSTMLFWSSMPGNGASLPEGESYYLFLDQAVNMLINDTNYKNRQGTYAMRLIDRIEAKPVIVDLSDGPYEKGIIDNRNKFILGPSGSGKSFFTNHMLRHYYEGGAHVLIVDIGDSYKTQCKLIQEESNNKDGLYYTYEEDNPISFNPFITAQKYDDIERRQTINALLTTLWKSQGENLDKFDEVTLDNIVNEYIDHISKNKDIKPSFNNFYEYTDIHFRKKLGQTKTGERKFDIDNFLYILQSFYKGGKYDYLLNSEKELDLLQERLIIFELRNIKEHPILLPVVTLMIMDAYTNKLYRLKGERKIMIIEEAWKAISRSTMAEYIKFLYKTVRKHDGEAIIVTQELDDIISSEIIKSTIIKNSDCKILLDQSKYQNNFSDLQSLLGLTNKQKEQILSINKNLIEGINYKEVWIGLGATYSAIYGVEVSQEEYYAYNSREDIKNEIDRKTEHYNSLQTAIKDLCGY